MVWSTPEVVDSTAQTAPDLRGRRDRALRAARRRLRRNRRLNHSSARRFGSPLALPDRTRPHVTTAKTTPVASACPARAAGAAPSEGSHATARGGCVS